MPTAAEKDMVLVPLPAQISWAGGPAVNRECVSQGSGVLVRCSACKSSNKGQAQGKEEKSQAKRTGGFYVGREVEEDALIKVWEEKIASRTFSMNSYCS